MTNIVLMTHLFRIFALLFTNLLTYLLDPEILHILGNLNGPQLGDADRKRSVDSAEYDSKLPKSVLQGKLSALAVQIGYMG